MLLDTGLWASEPCTPAPHQVLWQQAVRQRKGRSLLQAVKEKKGSSRCPGRRASNPGLNLSGALCKNPLAGMRSFRRLRATICVCPDLLLRSKESFYDRLDLLHLVEAKKYTCDTTLAVQHDCLWNPLVVIVVCHSRVAPPTGNGNLIVTISRWTFFTVSGVSNGSTAKAKMASP